MRFGFAALLLAAAAAPTVAQDRKPPASNAELQKEKIEAAYANAPVEEREERSKGAVTVGGQRLPYTATAGTLTLRDLEGKPTASMFYTA